MTSTLRLPATRWGAFFSHLLISLGILIVLSALLAFVMFPGALFTLAGGVEGFRIIAGVDMVLGPLLTLVIYNRAKPLKELVRDLSVIGAIQLAALSAGMYVVYTSRPAAVTYAYDQFHTSKISEFDHHQAARPEGLKWLSPAYYNIELPSDNDEALAMMAGFEFSDVPARLRTGLYEPLGGSAEKLARQLRTGTGNSESVDQPCIVRTLATAFNTNDVCFNPDTFRFSKVEPPKPD